MTEKKEKKPQQRTLFCLLVGTPKRGLSKNFVIGTAGK